MTARLLALALALVATRAWAEPRGGYLPIRAPAVRSAAAVSSHIIYVHRCPQDGCFIQFGTVDDSRTHTSTIAQGSRTIGAFTQGDAIWASLVDCVKTTYSPFDVTITDVDPGDVPHFEEIVGGMPQDLRDDIPFAGGVAPFNCDEIPNGISFTFDVYGPDSVSLCWTAAQETAHTFGLDHELLATDPMTYLESADPKRFQDIDAGCGEYQARACNCPSRPTQNSYQMIVDLFGPGTPITPDVTITAPSDGKSVQPGFSVTATATSIVKIDHLELYIDGALAGSAMTPPYVFQPGALDLGAHALEVRAYDVQGTTGSATESIELDPPCTHSKGCDNGDVCVGGLCIAGPTIPGGLGAECTVNDQCLSMVCADGGDPEKHCAAPCDTSSANSCPSGFACLAAGTGGVCYPAAGGGCCNAGGEPRAVLVLAAGVVAIVLRRRRTP